VLDCHKLYLLSNILMNKMEWSIPMIQPINKEENSLLLYTVCESSMVLFFNIKQLHSVKI